MVSRIRNAELVLLVCQYWLTDQTGRVVQGWLVECRWIGNWGLVWTGLVGLPTVMGLAWGLGWRGVLKGVERAGFSLPSHFR